MKNHAVLRIVCRLTYKILEQTPSIVQYLLFSRNLEGLIQINYAVASCVKILNTAKNQIG